MNNSDFLRQLPGGAGPMHSQRSLSQRLRIDPILLVLLLILSGVGLAVLYSASDENSAVVLRQGRFLSVAFVVMLLVAQLHAEQLQRFGKALEPHLSVPFFDAVYLHKLFYLKFIES